ncbi:unnamed protein product (macronuclear) [Paramecium tetraurelia]|uniref:TLDc domain-containing protein n=1 Tax=Paramecium tetraurelia TaxID=5888 RepID=A0BHT1_PARTE|nr:uncharacterized protein GSPATT00029134001 [Paramecium tetraurelia]CAK58098.1 unnamed protein product [Paramecium tetraurelia]|eukprot:XP_001425496.1 hypothetical protein (macronuclear) [Paramecium tetraurelia strain d4-2]
MNSSSQKNEIRENMCQIHNREIIAIDLNSTENGSIKYLCCDCIVEKLNNNRISTIEQTQARIQEYQALRQEKKAGEIKIKLQQYKIVLEKYSEFKINACNSLVKIYDQIKTQISILEEKQSLLRKFQTTSNFQEDVKSLSEFLSLNENQIEFQQDTQSFDDLIRELELIFNKTAYQQTIITFKEAKQKIQEFNEGNQIKLMPLQFENNKKAQSLSRLCPTHNKEILLIDLESKNKQIEERFACLECVGDEGFNCKQKSIEKINLLWNQKKINQIKFVEELKSKRQSKQEKLNKKIQQMRENYNSKINSISEQLITNFPLPITKTSELSKFKQVSIQQLSNEELNQTINYLIQQDNDNIQNEYMITKDIQFTNSIESQLEQLKQNDLLDIQESINILHDQSSIKNSLLLADNKLQGILQLSKLIQQSTIVEQQQQIRKQELDELISSSKQIYSQLDLLNYAIEKFQQHNNKVISIKNKIQSIPDHENFSNIQQQLTLYLNNFEKDFKDLKKFCEIDQLESAKLALQQDYTKLQLENKELEINLQNIVDELIEKLKVEQNKNAQCQEQSIVYQNEIKQLAQKIIDKEDLIKTHESLFDKFGLNLKPKLLQDDFWVRLSFYLQEKSKKKIHESLLIYQGTRDGLNKDQFWNKCDGKSNLLMIFQSESGYIFGGYSPCQWIQYTGKYIQDNSKQSFLFSQTHFQFYPMKTNGNCYAIYSNNSSGPVFGDGHDIKIDSNFKDGYSNLGHGYIWDQYQGAYSKHLFGQDKPNIAECEIYELKLN